MVFEEILFKGAVRAVGGVLEAKQRQAEFRAIAGAGSLGEILDDVKRSSRDPLDLDNLATQLGLGYSRWDDLGLHDRKVPLYRLGRDGEIENVVHGLVAGTPLAVFDYAYDTGIGDQHVEQHRTCAQVGLPAEVASFRLWPDERRQRRAVPAEGPLAERHQLDTADEPLARRLLTEEVAAWVVDGPDDLEYHTGGHWALVVSKTRRLDRWEGLARRGVVWAARVGAVASGRARLV